MPTAPAQNPLAQPRGTVNATITTLAQTVFPTGFEGVKAIATAIVDVAGAKRSMCGKSVIVRKQLSEFGQLVAVFRT